MVKVEDLKQISLLKDSSQQLLDIISKEAQLSIFNTDTRLITIHEKVDTFYMLLMGQVAIIRELTPDIDVILDYVQAGASFGVSSIVKDSVATYTAVCQEPCEVITFSGERMMELFKENHELAFYMMRDVSGQYKRNIDRQINMLAKTVGHNQALKDKIHDIDTFSL